MDKTYFFFLSFLILFPLVILSRESNQEALFISTRQFQYISTIHEINLETGKCALISGNIFDKPYSMILGSNDICYFTQLDIPAIYSYDKKTSDTKVWTPLYPDGPTSNALILNLILWHDEQILVEYDGFIWVDPSNGNITRRIKWDQWTGFNTPTLGYYCSLSDGTFAGITPVFANESVYHIVKMDPDAKTKTLIASINNPDLKNPGGMVEDTNNDLLIWDKSLSAIKRLNPVTKEITTFVDHTSFQSLCISTSGTIYGVMDAPVKKVVRIDNSTGEFTDISSQELGSGPMFISPNIAFCNDNTLYLFDSFSSNIYQVDVLTGNRALIPKYKGKGDILQLPMGICVAGKHELIAANSEIEQDMYHDDSILSIDLPTGDRTIVSGKDIGTGPAISLPQSITKLSSGEFAIANMMVVDKGSYNSYITALDPLNGNRRLISGDTRGSGPPLEFPGKMIEISSGTLAVCDAKLYPTPDGIRGIVLIDISTGDRSILCHYQDGKYPPIIRPRDITLGIDGYIYLVDWGEPAQVFNEDILRINPETGDREIFYDEPEGPEYLLCLDCITTLPNGNFAVTDSIRILIIDYQTSEILNTFNYNTYLDIPLSYSLDMCIGPAYFTSIKGALINYLIGEIDTKRDDFHINHDDKIDISDLVSIILEE